MPRAVDLADAARRIARIALVDDDHMFLRVFAANLQAIWQVGHARQARRADSMHRIDTDNAGTGLTVPVAFGV